MRTKGVLDKERSTGQRMLVDGKATADGILGFDTLFDYSNGSEKRYDHSIEHKGKKKRYVMHEGSGFIDVWARMRQTLRRSSWNCLFLEMASRYADYRTTIDNHSNSSGSIVLSDDDDDYVVLKHNRCKKNVIVDSDSESEKELDNLPFHSTVIADHVLPNFEEMCVDNREERISDIAGQRSSLSTNSMSDHDVFQSSEESEQKSPVKPRKSTRISLALGKLLTIDSEAVSAACRKSLCNAKETFKNPSRDGVCDDEGEKCEKTVTLLSSDDSESEEGDIVKSGTDKNYFQNSHDNNFGCKKKNILVQKHDGTVAHFSSDDSVDETETTLKNENGSEKNLQASQERKNSKSKNKKILVQRHDGSVAHFSSDDSEDEIDQRPVENGMLDENTIYRVSRR
ncbi:Protein of unknown function [Gryllus bimaculatus]|nr:Protein of unknown function [Gryllus bimaculatus]